MAEPPKGGKEPGKVTQDVLRKISTLESDRFSGSGYELLQTKPHKLGDEIIIRSHADLTGRIKISIVPLAREIMVIPSTQPDNAFAQVIKDNINGIGGYKAWVCANFP